MTKTKKRLVQWERFLRANPAVAKRLEADGNGEDLDTIKAGMRSALDIFLPTYINFLRLLTV